MVDAVSSTSNSIMQESAAEKARTKISGDFDTFLLMLTTQLKNQDPSEPMDSNEFTAQLVQFANVEQAIATNENLEKLLEMNSSSEISNAASYIGKYVEAKGDAARLKDGVVAFSFDLPQKAYQTEVIIKDDLGNIVYKGSGPTEKGQNDVLWDGTTNLNGAGDKVPDGIYHISVIAKDTQLEPVEATTYTTGFISAVDIEEGVAIYRIGDIELTLDEIRTVRDPMDLVGGSGETA